MKKILAVVSILSVIAPAAAIAREREFNGDLAEWRREMREQRVAEARAREIPPTPPARGADGCAVMNLDGATISRGVFSSDFDVENGGSKIGVVDSGSKGWTLKNGSAVAASIVSDGSVVIVKDCSGNVIGSVVESASSEQSHFTIKDAAGNAVAQSGWVDGHSMVLKGAGGMVSVLNSHWLIDSYTISIHGVDQRLAAAAVLMNNAALYRRSGERNRENRMDRAGGRADRI